MDGVTRPTAAPSGSNRATMDIPIIAVTILCGFSGDEAKTRGWPGATPMSPSPSPRAELLAKVRGFIG